MAEQSTRLPILLLLVFITLPTGKVSTVVMDVVTLSILFLQSWASGAGSVGQTPMKHVPIHSTTTRHPSSTVTISGCHMDKPVGDFNPTRVATLATRQQKHVRIQRGCGSSSGTVPIWTSRVMVSGTSTGARRSNEPMGRSWSIPRVPILTAAIMVLHPLRPSLCLSYLLLWHFSSISVPPCNLL